MKKPKMKNTGFFTQKDIERGIYDFLIDHAYPIENTTWRATVNFTTKEELIRRIYARATNAFKIKDEKDVKKQLDKKVAHFKTAMNFYNKQIQKNNLYMKLRDNHTLKYRILVLMRSIFNSIEKLLLK